MRRSATTLAACFAALTLLIFGGDALSGDLNPPAGPVQPTGHTLTDIFNSIGPVEVPEAAAAENRDTSFAPTAPPSLPPYARITGVTQGLITNLDLTQLGFEEYTRVYHYAHEIDHGFDEGSGLPTGRRQHKPFTMTLVFAPSTPKLYAAMENTEPLTVEVEFWRPSQTGQEIHYFTIELTDATIVNIRPRSIGVNPGLPSHEYDVSFTYQNILWKHEVAGVQHSIDW